MTESASVHPTAVVEPGAKLGAGAVVGPQCWVGSEVELGERVVLVSHVAVAGRTSIGAGTRVYPFASLGHPPQDRKYRGEPSRLVIGREAVIREHVTMNPGTAGGGMETVVGDHNLFMAGCHVAHDCRIGDHVVLANHATLGGHVTIGDHVILGGLSAVHQFVRIGRHAMVGGMSGVEHDVVPFGLVLGERAHLAGLNLVGLRRHGFSRDDVARLGETYQILFRAGGALLDRVGEVEATYPGDPLVAEIVRFIRDPSGRGVLVPADGG